MMENAILCGCGMITVAVFTLSVVVGNGLVSIEKTIREVESRAIQQPLRAFKQ